MASLAVRLLISGRVQGVAYRAWTVQEAHRRGLSGWVRNCRDGSVEAVIRGEQAAVEALAAACHRGPPHAQVTNVLREPYDGAVEEGFEQRPTV